VAIAVITGATVGIGRSFADALARKGMDLVLVARDADRLAEVAADLTDRYAVACEVVPADLSVRADVDRVAALIVDRRVGVLVNNAGFGLSRAFERSDLEDEQRLLDVLVTAVMRLTHAAVPGMVERGFGLIVNVGSLAAWLPGGTYSAAKAWVTTFTESLAASLAGTGVRAVVAAPGFTRTQFHARAGIDTGSLPSFLWLDADRVVAATLRDAAAGRSVSVAGAVYRALSVPIRFGPRSLARRATSTRQRHPGLGARKSGAQPPRP